mmetsp:Transcript_21340/g.52576  ORF Transcript_21340/g.52576 Transcript_21340/m.52576 type:complete len:203 (-) Transcript_21340:639-1247(-)
MRLDSLRLHQTDAAGRTQSGRAASHIKLHHLDHGSWASLDVVAARIKGQTLANHSNLARHRPLGLVRHVNELGRLAGALSDTKVGAHAKLLAVLTLQDFALHTRLLCDLLCHIGEFRGRDVVRRSGDQVLAEGHAKGRLLGEAEGSLGAVDGAPHKLDLLQRQRLLVLLLGLEPRVLVKRDQGSFGHLLDHASVHTVGKNDS